MSSHDYLLLGPCETNDDCDDGEECIDNTCTIKGKRLRIKPLQLNFMFKLNLSNTSPWTHG